MAEVVEAYRDFSPPRKARETIEDLLASVPTEHLTGLRTIVLTNSGSLGRRRRRAWSRSRGRRASHAHVAGLYHGTRKSEGAWIELFVDHIVAGPPTWLLRLRLVRAILFAPVLFHEVGHHIHARFRPEHREHEDVADEWADTLGRVHMRRRHAFVRLLLRPVFWLSRFRSTKRAAASHSPTASSSTRSTV